MKLLKTLLPLIIPLGLAANDLSNGAFGINFGKEFPDSNKLIVQVNPELPIRAFDEYRVRLTPSSKRVYSIEAHKEQSNESTFRQCLRVLKLFKEKKLVHLANYNCLNCFKGLDDRFNKVELDCGMTSFDSAKLILTSNDLLKIAKDERAELANKEFESLYEEFKKSGF